MYGENNKRTILVPRRKKARNDNRHRDDVEDRKDNLVSPDGAESSSSSSDGNLNKSKMVKQATASSGMLDKPETEGSLPCPQLRVDDPLIAKDKTNMHDQFPLDNDAIKEENQPTAYNVQYYDEGQTEGKIGGPTEKRQKLEEELTSIVSRQKTVEYNRSIARAVVMNDIECTQDILEEMKRLEGKLEDNSAALNQTLNEKDRYEEIISQLHQALMTAVTYKSVKMTELILENCAQKVCFKWGPIVLKAIDVNKEEILELLMSHGADASVTHPETALHAAAKNGNVKILQLLWNHGIYDINVTDIKNGLSPFHAAAICKKINSMQFLLNKGADINSRSPLRQTALHSVASRGYMEGVKWLVEHGADVRAIDLHYNMPWMLALERKHTCIVDLLVSEHGLECADDEGRRPIHYACITQYRSNIVQYLADKKVDLDVRDHAGMTPLMHALGHCSFESVQSLVKLGVNLNILDYSGKTAMFYCPFPKNVLWLIENGANPNIVAKNGETILQNFVTEMDGRFDISDLSKLFYSNIDIKISEVQGPDGLTPVMKSIKFKNSKMVNILVNAGCSLRNVKAWLTSEESNLESTDNFMQTKVWLNDMVLQFPTLQQLCKTTIRVRLGHGNVKEKISQLPVPRKMQEFLDQISSLN